MKKTIFFYPIINGVIQLGSAEIMSVENFKEALDKSGFLYTIDDKNIGIMITGYHQKENNNLTPVAQSG